MSTSSGYSVVMSYRSEFISPATGSTTASTTTRPPRPPPTTPHPHAYERSTSQGRVSDADIELLKNVIRASKEVGGWSAPPPPPRSRRRFNLAEPPRIAPKSNGTSRIRMEWRAYRLYQRCGAVLEPPVVDEEEQPEAPASPPAAPGETPKRLLQAMFRQAKQLTPEQVDDELDRRELQRLREQALAAKPQGSAAFRQNNCSTYRYKMARGEPIITSHFRETFSDFARPPYTNAARRLNLRYATGARHRRLPIDKSAEIWLWPVEGDDDEGGIPLHRRPKEVPAQQKDDRRSAREKARPPLRQHAKADRTEARHADRRPTRIPWNYGVPKTPLLVSARDGLINDELLRRMEEEQHKVASRGGGDDDDGNKSAA